MVQIKKFLFPVLAVMFSCLLGTVGMISQDVPVYIWIQNVVSSIMLTVITVFLCNIKIRLNDQVMVFISCLLLGLTFFQEGYDGVHRWILGSLYISSILLPITVIFIDRILKQGNVIFAFISIVFISVILFLQPDAAQLTGFSAAMLVCLFSNHIFKSMKLILCGILVVLTALSWIFVDHLPAVSYVEGILTMLSEVSFILYCLGLLAVFLLPIPFVACSSRKNKRLSVSIMLYYWGITISAFFGNFPVPVMGYGISPIIGYFMVLLWQVNQGDEHD
ncbi:MAG: hypothetical protein ACOX60_07770 [Massiliimalia sp.]